MRKSFLTFIMLLNVTTCLAATDGAYTLSEVPESWDGTQGNVYAPVTADYDYAYGDDTTLIYNLPWTFFFYGRGYSRITVDANGAVWFDASTSAHDFNLAQSGRGLVIAPWNLDLSSTYEGGVFVEHKANPERVVVEWRTETYSDEGDGLLNVFETVIFADGTIRTDYQTFSAVNPTDFGSGISKDDGTYFLSTSLSYGNSATLGGRSFNFVPTGSSGAVTLGIDVIGTGTGWVTSTLSGIACNTNCFIESPIGTAVTLHAQASPYSAFVGWNGGGCSGTGDCILTLSENTLVSANFTSDAAHRVLVDGGIAGYYATLQEAYDAASSGTVMKLWATDYNESLTCAKPITVTLQGGYDDSFTVKTGETVLGGTLTIIDGVVIIDGLSIR